MNASVPLQDPQIRFIFDNLIDSVKDQSLILFESLDTHTSERVWILSRRLGESGKIMPLGMLLPDTNKSVQRYAPANGDGTWNTSMISDIIKP
jgi:hypothetical protein